MWEVKALDVKRSPTHPLPLLCPRCCCMRKVCCTASPQCFGLCFQNRFWLNLFIPFRIRSISHIDGGHHGGHPGRWCVPRRAHLSPRDHTCIPSPHIPPNLTLPRPHCPSISRHLCALRATYLASYCHALCHYCDDAQRVSMRTRLIHRSPRDSSGTWQHPRYGTAGPYHCNRGCCRSPVEARVGVRGVCTCGLEATSTDTCVVCVCVCE